MGVRIEQIKGEKGPVESQSSFAIGVEAESFAPLPLDGPPPPLQMSLVVMVSEVLVSQYPGPTRNSPPILQNSGVTGESPTESLRTLDLQNYSVGCGRD